MPLEDKIDTLTVAINNLTAKIQGGATVAGTAGKPAATAGKPAKAKITVEKVSEMAAKVKTEISVDGAKHLIKTVGLADKLAEIKPAQYEVFVAACTAALEAGEVDMGEEAAEEEI
jgi:hypothetical protein